MLPPARLALAAFLLLAWLGLCWHAWRRTRPVLSPAGEWTVVYASQTGTAQTLAEESAARLGVAGVLPLDRLSPQALAAGGRFLFIVATAGDGEAPDNARHFVARLADFRRTAGDSPLRACRYSLLALGDDRYPAFCAFGRQLDGVLTMAGATAWQAAHYVNRGDADVVEAWFAALPAVAVDTTPACPPARPVRWCLREREYLNPGSPGGEIHRLVFAPLDGVAPTWQSGDLASIRLEGWDAARDYSIASLPADGCLQLLVRRQVDAHGRPGLASNFLCRELRVGESVDWRIRPHAAFALDDNARRPLILIGGGVGLAGLMAHLKAARAAGGDQHWLFYGERCPRSDGYASRLLPDAGLRLEQVFSRCPDQPGYVQHRLQQCAVELRAWVEHGAAIYVCGSRRGMGEGVEQTLRELLGEAGLAGLAESGRYRRDVF